MEYYDETGDGYGGIVRGGARTFTTAVVLPGAEQVFANALGVGVYVQATETIENAEGQTTETITMVEANENDKVSNMTENDFGKSVDISEKKMYQVGNILISTVCNMVIKIDKV